MSSKRKLWASQLPGRIRIRHQSQAATYRYVQKKAADWHAGLLEFDQVKVFVDERDGQGWQTYERVDLPDVARTLTTPEEKP